MSQTFKTNVNATFDFEINKDAVSNLDVIQISDSKQHVIHQNTSYHIEILESDFNNKFYQIKVNNTLYKVSIFNDLDILIDDMGFSVSASKQVNFIKAPMPGLILDLRAQVNQEVKENDTLIILEAMKMENMITSPRDGIIKSIAVKQGDAVEKNQLLIEFE
ncbi:acetyl-CoA carboxylase biotin carboxyl carrier protein subunit [Oceanihabitans sp. IOP_32]|uniref:acetyl-CoA carboxylase biotin carboxyl carrier protein subunit n=1 Tax=Oceanihabitans sp. IOP_32 TaxID=2529032 RepID=UPI001292E4F9|nr:acetyl-CoA carboxylase biotin carboxyl carrier protein subunit [Oceanihabitans sp. IOP_32]QFZ53489.1 acetyl-CoA carboxylase biotin carboxyl carrier protein subunit [Oceanihabitans sp. IOP_32]